MICWGSTDADATTYEERRGQVETYFDKTAAQNWSDLTSDVPVSGIRKTVRAGRDRMRATILEWLPRDLRGARVLDAGCGTGAMAHDAAMRGADVVAVDLAPNLIEVAKERYCNAVWPGEVEFIAGRSAGRQSPWVRSTTSCPWMR